MKMKLSALPFDGGAGSARASATVPLAPRLRRESSDSLSEPGLEKGARAENQVSPMQERVPA
jgi:hypothetical protein